MLGVFISILSALGIWYIYDGYGRILVLLSYFHNNSAEKWGREDLNCSLVSVIVPVFNEEEHIAAKIENILSQKLNTTIEILIISDGSTDKTEEITYSYKDRGVRLFRTSGRVGKSLAQNLGVAKAKGDILVLTDVAVIMAPKCISALISPFENQNIGCTTARLLFSKDPLSDVGEAQGFYWSYELKLRHLESRLGILSTAAGPAMAIRKTLWKDLPPEYGDDCVLPLDVIIQGFKVIQVEDAIAWDKNFKSFEKEYRARTRMTVRNWTGTVSRGVLLNPFKHFRYAFALWSHKMLRWLSPLFFLMLGVGLSLLGISGISWLPFVLYLLTLFTGGVGVMAMAKGKKTKGLSILASLIVANIGFFMGLVRVMRGRLVKVYDNKS